MSCKFKLKKVISWNFEEIRYSYSMKVWIDILTPKQTLFFEPLIEALQERGDEVVITSRRYREAELMLRKRQINAVFIGSHGGKRLDAKLTASLERSNELTEYFKHDTPDVLVSFSSPEACRVAFGLGIINLCVSDSPHAEAVSRLTVPLADCLLTPWIIPDKSWTGFGIERNKIEQYKALDPYVWLSRRDLSDKKDVTLNIDKSKSTITLRLEESFASYVSNNKNTHEFVLIKRLIEEFRDQNIVILCRYSEQVDEVYKKFKGRVIVPTDVVDGVALLQSSDLFIGLGGTMTAEASLLGTPTISFFSGSYFVERYLISKGLLTKPRDVDGVIRVSKNFLRDTKLRKQMKIRSNRIRSGMEDPIQVIIKKLDILIREKLNEELARK